jgi:1-acyl-sn-glycerol-3-phosphate acyltransferase
MTRATRVTSALPTWRFFAALWFWCHVARETFTSRRFSRVLERRLRGREVVASGRELVPTSGPFLFASNHYHAGLTLDVLGAALGAAASVRPGVADACTVVVGHRVPDADARRRGHAWRAVLRWAARRFFDRWSRNTLRIPTGPLGGGVARLRGWRRRAACGPMLVFPEGVAKGELASMRDGAGRWLAALGVPILPVGVWWADGRWNVSFGAPITWSRRGELRDLQLGLAIAVLLPPVLAPSWSESLARWRAAHRRGVERPSRRRLRFT